jgi:hypothetical protein
MAPSPGLSRMKRIVVALVLIGFAASLAGCSKCGRWYWEPQSCGRP